MAENLSFHSVRLLGHNGTSKPVKVPIFPLALLAAVAGKLAPNIAFSSTIKYMHKIYYHKTVHFSQVSYPSLIYRERWVNIIFYLLCALICNEHEQIMLNPLPTSGVHCKQFGPRSSPTKSRA